MKTALLLIGAVLLLSFLLACRFASGKILEPVWVAPLATAGPPLVAGGRVFVWGFPAGKPGDPYRVYALDARTGKELWSVPAECEPSVLTRGHHEFLSLGSEGQVLLLSKRNSVRGFDAPTGKPLSLGEAGKARFLQRFLVEGRAGFGVNKEGKLVHLDPANGSVLWSVPFLQGDETREYGKHDLFMREKTLLAVSPYRKRLNKNQSEFRTLLTALDPETGRVLWHYEPETIGNVTPAMGALAAYSSFQALSVLDGLVFLTLSETTVATSEKGSTWFAMDTLTALDLTTGRPRYKKAPGGRILGKKGADLWLNGQTLDFAAKQAHFNAGLDPVSGAERWRKDWSIDGLFQKTMVWKERNDTQIDWGNEYTGDRRGSRMRPGWFTSMNLTSAFLTLRDTETNQEIGRSEKLKSTEMSLPVAWDDLVFVSTVAEMKEGRSGVWAYRAPRGPGK